jgi:hypothetical protein
MLESRDLNLSTRWIALSSESGDNLLMEDQSMVYMTQIVMQNKVVMTTQPKKKPLLKRKKKRKGDAKRRKN